MCITSDQFKNFTESEVVQKVVFTERNVNLRTAQCVMKWLPKAGRFS